MQAFFVFLSWTFMGHILGYEGFDTLIEGEGKIWDKAYCDVCLCKSNKLSGINLLPESSVFSPVKIKYFICFL